MFLECVGPTQNGNLSSKPNPPGVMMIRKCRSGEASTFSRLYWIRPISLLIFSGAIVLTAHTIEIVPQIQGTEKSAQIPFYVETAANQRGCEICDRLWFRSCSLCIYKTSLITWAETQWASHSNRKTFMVKQQPAMIHWQWQLGPAVIVLWLHKDSWYACGMP